MCRERRDSHIVSPPNPSPDLKSGSAGVAIKGAPMCKPAPSARHQGDENHYSLWPYMAQDDEHTPSKQGRLCQRRCADQARRTATSLSGLVPGSTGAINNQYHASRAFASDNWQASITQEGDDARLHAAVSNLIQGAKRLLPPLARLVGADQHGGCDGIRLKSAVPRLDHEVGRSLPLLTLLLAPITQSR